MKYIWRDLWLVRYHRYFYRRLNEARVTGDRGWKAIKYALWAGVPM